MVKNNGRPNYIAGPLDKNSNHMVFSSDDLRLKLLGEIFGNDTSRGMITVLIEKEMTATQISCKLGLKINLVMYHLNKMLSLGIISITKKTKNSKGHQVKHYKAKQAVMIFSNNAKSRAEKSKMLSNVVKRITRFSAMGMAGIGTWLGTSISIQGDRITNSMDAALKYPRPTLPSYMTPIEPQSSGDGIIPIVLGVAVVISVLIVDRFIIPRIHLRHNPIK